MAQNRIDLSEKADMNLRVYMAKNRLKNKQDAINDILENIEV